jgi:hypothetical protein
VTPDHPHWNQVLVPRERLDWLLDVVSSVALPVRLES